MPKYNKSTFYAEVKKTLFKDRFTSKKGPDQIKGMDLILDEAEKRNVPLDELAYILATVYHETAFTMQPIKEYGGTTYLKKKKYYPYYGRGYIMLTWEENYKKASDKYGADFVKSPDLVMDNKYAIPILFDGMKDGWFTNKKLSDFIDNKVESDAEDIREYTEARKIVNGTDKDKEIAKYAMDFRKALNASWISNEEPIKKAPEVPVGGAVAAGGALILIEPIQALANAIAAQKDLLTSGGLWKVAVGLLIVGGALYTVYARWDAAGRPNIFRRA